MADEFTKWHRNATVPTKEKKTMEVKWKAAHAALTRPAAGNERFKREAARDRVIFRWVMAVLGIVGLVAYVAYIVISRTGS